MLNSFFPKKLATPYVPLGASIEEGLSILRTLDGAIEERNEEEHSFRVDTPRFDVAIFDDDGEISAVWFDDPLGRRWARGRARKISLYLDRYAPDGGWELRQDNGWMHYYFNESASAQMVYGVHKDVIRFNTWHAA